MPDPSQHAVVVTGAAGALGGAYVRALAAHGYAVRAIDRRPGAVRVFGCPVADPYLVPDPEAVVDVPIIGVDLAEPDDGLMAAMRGARAVVMTAANPLPFQSKASAATNHAIDINTIDAALAAGVGIVIYTSSLWRLDGLLEGDALVRPEMSAPRGHYGESKQATWEAMRTRAAGRPDVHFVVNDHGWYPREAMGAPPTNVADRALQAWTAERETQQHILKQIGIAAAGHTTNFHGFIVASRNVPTADAVRRGHRPFVLDLSNSARLGVEHRANVYDLLDQYRLWRDAPIYLG